MAAQGGEPNVRAESLQLTTHWHSRWGITAWRNQKGIWSSRRLRKGHGPLARSHFQQLTAAGMVQALVHGKQLNRLEVRTALAFIAGPLLFALGAGLPLAHQGNASLAAGLLAIGSVLFTAGGWWQVEQALLAVPSLPDDTKAWQWCGLRCSLSQSLGTVLFNINTFFLWGWPQPQEQSWLLLAVLPNLLGSILFLVSAADGLLEVGHGRLLVFEPKHLGWWIAMVNTLGCLWFMQSALASLPNALPKLTSFNNQMALQTTVLGSLAFAIVGILSLAECSEDEVAEPRPNPPQA
ncbi:MAG: hypothetical protein EVB08_08800 [Synechococcus sp. MED-G135]|nr:MAG: hypothetical protein EVB08_08800 [Synechococcus sp. MED-G135]